MDIRWLVLSAPLPRCPRPRRPLPARRSIVVLGDSLTSGRGIGKDAAYPAILQQRLEDSGYEYEVVNAGISGDTTARALRRYRDTLDDDVEILIVALGANDGLRGVPVDQVKSNLSVIMEDAQRRGIETLLVGMDALPLRGWDYSVAFHRLYEDLAAAVSRAARAVPARERHEQSLADAERSRRTRTGTERVRSPT